MSNPNSATLKDAIAAIKSEPTIRHIVSVSGGKDSAALAVYLKQAHPEIPAEYVFCDTQVPFISLDCMLIAC